jgi:hypothetical protein
MEIPKEYKELLIESIEEEIEKVIGLLTIG